MNAAEYKHIVLGLIFVKYIESCDGPNLMNLIDTLFSRLISGQLRFKERLRVLKEAA